MKKCFSLLLALFLLISTLAGCGQTAVREKTGSGPEPGELVLYTWEGMFPQEVLDGFTQETGVAVNYANFDFDETMLTKLQAAGGGDYDVVVADDYIIETVIGEGLAKKLDISKLENYKSIDPLYQGQFYDPDDEYTVPYGAGVQTLVYDPAAVGKELTGYGDLWDPSLRDSVGIIANFRVINGMALKVLGESYNTEDPAAIEKAGEKLMELAPNIRLIKDDRLEEDLLSGEISVAVMYTNQVTAARLANPELKVVFPKEGIGFGVQGMFIPTKAPHAEEAYQFMDYILRPEISAQCFEYLGYYCTNKDAAPLISPECRDLLTDLPEEFSAGNREMIENISTEAVDAHDRVWTEFKAACE